MIEITSIHKNVGSLGKGLPCLFHGPTKEPLPKAPSDGVGEQSEVQQIDTGIIRTGSKQAHTRGDSVTYESDAFCKRKIRDHFLMRVSVFLVPTPILTHGIVHVPEIFRRPVTLDQDRLDNVSCVLIRVMIRRNRNEKLRSFRPQERANDRNLKLFGADFGTRIEHYRTVAHCPEGIWQSLP